MSTKKKAAKKAAKPAEAAKPKAIKVEAVKPIAEAGGYYKKGDTFEVTPKRAEALGKLVKPASDE